jgi:hypothetical protein
MRAPLRGRSVSGAAKAAPRRRYVRRLRRAARACVLVAAAGSTSACYTYTLIDPAQAGAGLEVRARITPEESARIDALIGSQGRVLEGEIVGTESAGIIIAVPTVLQDNGLASARLHQRLTLPTSSIVELEQRRLDRLRTFSLVGAIAAVAGYAVISQFGTSSDDPGGDKPGPENLVVPLLRIRFP